MHRVTKMLSVCSEIGEDLSIQFSAKKSMFAVIGSYKYKPLCNMSVNNCDLVWCNKIKYLGSYLKSDVCFKVDFSEARRRYFYSLNSILCNSKFCSDIVKLELIEKQCFPLLLYCMESLSLSKSEIDEINSCINLAYRKIFGYNRWESVRSLLFYLGRLDLFHW